MPSPVRWSTLREMRRSPAHYRHALTAPRVETPAMRLGTAVHALVFGTDSFDVWSGIRRGKEWEAFKSDHDGVTIINQDELETASAIARSVTENPLARRMLFGDQERRIEWAEAGRDCAGTPDVIGDGFLTDLKTTTDASPERFPFQARKMAYHAQLSWYRNGYGRFAGLDVRDFDLFIVAVEVKPPYPVTAWLLSPSAVDMGERIWRSCFERLLVCEASDQWPGYSDAIQQLDAIEDFQLSIDGEDVEL